MILPKLPELEEEAAVSWGGRAGREGSNVKRRIRDSSLKNVSIRRH